MVETETITGTMVTTTTTVVTTMQAMATTMQEMATTMQAMEVLLVEETIRILRNHLVKFILQADADQRSSSPSALDPRVIAKGFANDGQGT